VRRRPDRRPCRRRIALVLAPLWVAAALGGCSGEPDAPDPRPSLLLVVIDTLRADAVSAYGARRDTTPALDRLAAAGLRYEHAWAPAPWTVPSHATLFTGLGPERHRVGTGPRIVLPAGATTVAERLAAAGYQTLGVSENPLVSEALGFAQGFERFRARRLAELERDLARPGSSGFDAVATLEAWLAARDPARPFFAFVNLFEPHEPYAVRERNPFLPAGVDAEAAAAVVQSPDRICAALPPPDELAILEGLYLGDVRAADASLAALHAAASAASGGALVTVVTSDHGEHLGEHGLLDHQFTVWEEALHVPLVVHGLPGAASATIAAPVGLADVAASLLAWAHVEREAGAGPPLPTSADASPPSRDLLAFYGDGAVAWPAGVPRPSGADTERKRRHCGADDRVFGDLAALIRYPHKLVRFERHPPALFDLRWDAAERSDQAALQPGRARTLATALERAIEAHAPFASPDAGAPDPAAVERLRGLGYVD
jgi:arylsulfatase A-like enzyme